MCGYGNKGGASSNINSTHKVRAILGQRGEACCPGQCNSAQPRSLRGLCYLEHGATGLASDRDVVITFLHEERGLNKTGVFLE